MPVFRVNYTIRLTVNMLVRRPSAQDAEDDVANMGRPAVRRRFGDRVEAQQIHNITVNSVEEHDPNSPGRSTT